MIRLAKISDAEQLFRLNEKFNGEDESTLEYIKESLSSNQSETVIVAEENDMIVGFVCVQMKKSFCCDSYSAEITELFVDEKYRRKKYASKMIAYAESYLLSKNLIRKFELLTEKNNVAAQYLYNSLGYYHDDEIHLAKKQTQIK